MFTCVYSVYTPIPVAARSKALVCGRSFPGIVSSNPAGGIEVSLWSVVCCEVEVSAPGCSLVQRSPTACDVSECDRQASIFWRPWPTRDCCDMVKKNSVCTLFTCTLLDCKVLAFLSGWSVGEIFIVTVEFMVNKLQQDKV